MLSFGEVAHSKNKKVIFYHKDCADGFCSAYLLWRILGDCATYDAVAYGSDLPGLPDERCDVMMVDFSAPIDVLLEIASKHNLAVFDHHKTAQEALRGNEHICNFDLLKSGAKLVEDWIGIRHPLVPYVMDRDLWQWKLLGSREVSAALASYPYEFRVWDQLNIEQLMSEGAAILRYQKQLLNLQASQSRLVIGSDCSYVLCNATAVQSEMGEHLLAKCPSARFAALYYITNDGRYRFSLRSRSASECDVSVIAKQYGGGGHPWPAGFHMSSNEAEQTIDLGRSL